jgi:hypothetical protein
MPERLSAGDEALLAMADAGPECRVAIVAPGALELSCALLRRGYGSVTMVQARERAPANQADIVIVPHAASVEAITHSIACARRILAPLGTVVIRLSINGMCPTPREAIPQLVLHGFTAIRTRIAFGAALLRGELPLYGHLKCV